MRKIIIALSVFLCSCATIIKGTAPEPIALTSSQGEVNIKITNSDDVVVYEGKTPLVVNLEAGKKDSCQAEYYTVFASKEGYEDYQTQIDALSYKGVFFQGIIGELIDNCTGAAFYLEKRDYTINMTPLL